MAFEKTAKREIAIIKIRIFFIRKHPYRPPYLQGKNNTILY